MSVKCLIYCTKAKPYLYHEGTEKWWFNEGVLEPFAYIEGYDLYKEKQKEMSNIDSGDVRKTIYKCLNGKIVAQFDCEKVEKFDVPYPAYFCEVKDKLEHITKGSCLSLLNLHHYMKNQKGYAIHISNLKIFDNPKQLSDYVYLTCGYEQCSKCKYYYTWGECVPQEFELEKAPQNMMNVWKKRNIFTELSERKKEHYVLISIRPEYVAKILNGEKTIEVRRKILNCLKDLI